MEKLCRVLIIDDEYIMRQGFKYMLDWEKEGFMLVGEAADGKEGLKLMEEKHPHLVFLDIMMPGIDGMEFAQIVQQKYPESRIIVLSSYDNFEYVKNTLLCGAIDYILKPTLNPKELKRVLKEALLTLKEFGRKETGDTTEVKKQIALYLSGKNQEAMRDYALPGERGILFGVWNSLPEDQPILKDICMAHFKISSNVEVLLPEMGKYLVFFLFGEAAEILRLKKELISLTEKLCSYQEDVYTVTGRMFTECLGMKQEYEEVWEALFAHFYHHNKGNLDLSGEQRAICSKVKFEFDVYLNYLNTHDFFDAAVLLRDYIGSVIEQQMEEERLKNLSGNLLFNMQAAIKFDEKIFETLRKRMMCAVYAEDFRTEFEKILEELLVWWNDHNSPEDSKIRPILNYIGTHYKEDLKLNEIAEKFGFNYNYLSGYFNSIMQEGYSSYLNQVRIQKACEFLSEGSMPISEVGVEAGYLDHSYFCRVFKKKIGCTPREYRKIYLGRNKDEKTQIEIQP